MIEPNGASLMLPPQASTIAAEYDTLFYAVTYLCVICFILIMGAGTYFVIKYRWRGGKHQAVPISHNTALEVAWSVIPLFVVMGMFAWGFRNFVRMYIAPKDSIEIHVTGQKWNWAMEYSNGAVVGGKNVKFAVPINRPVKLILTSRDVLHSFFIPSFRVKMDAVPNRYTTLWFEATQLGEHQVFCAEYCGTDHSDMMGQVLVLSDQDYKAWLEKNAQLGATPEERGQKLFAGKGGCTACHATGKDQALPNIGPKLFQAFGRQEKLADGSTITVDENYIRESIEMPNAKLVAGFTPAMPMFKGVLSDKEIGDLIAYIKTLK